MRAVILALLTLTILVPIARGATNRNAIAIIIGNKTYSALDVPPVEYAYHSIPADARA